MHSIAFAFDGHVLWQVPEREKNIIRSWLILGWISWILLMFQKLHFTLPSLKSTNHYHTVLSKKSVALGKFQKIQEGLCYY